MAGALHVWDHAGSIVVSTSVDELACWLHAGSIGEETHWIGHGQPGHDSDWSLLGMHPVYPEVLAARFVLMAAEAGGGAGDDPAAFPPAAIEPEKTDSTGTTLAVREEPTGTAAATTFAPRGRVRVGTEHANTAIRYGSPGQSLPLPTGFATADGTIWMMAEDRSSMTVLFDEGAIVMFRSADGGVWDSSIKMLAATDDVSPDLQSGGATLQSAGNRVMDSLLLGNAAPVGPHRWRVFWHVKAVAVLKGTSRMPCHFDSGAAIASVDFERGIEPHMAVVIEGQLDATQVRRFVVAVTGEDFENLHVCRFLTRGKKKTDTSEAQPAGLAFTKCDRPPADPAIFLPSSEWCTAQLIPFLNGVSPSSLNSSWSKAQPNHASASASPAPAGASAAPASAAPVPASATPTSMMAPGITRSSLRPSPPPESPSAPAESPSAPANPFKGLGPTSLRKKDMAFLQELCRSTPGSDGRGLGREELVQLLIEKKKLLEKQLAAQKFVEDDDDDEDTDESSDEGGTPSRQQPSVHLKLGSARPAAAAPTKGPPPGSLQKDQQKELGQGLHQLKQQQKQLAVAQAETQRVHDKQVVDLQKLVEAQHRALDLAKERRSQGTSNEDQLLAAALTAIQELEQVQPPGEQTQPPVEQVGVKRHMHAQPADTPERKPPPRGVRTPDDVRELRAQIKGARAAAAADPTPARLQLLSLLKSELGDAQKDHDRESYI